MFVLPSETQELEQTLKRAQTILKQAHRRGVEIEHILEVGGEAGGEWMT